MSTMTIRRSLLAVHLVIAAALGVPACGGGATTSSQEQSGDASPGHDSGGGSGDSGGPGADAGGGADVGTQGDAGPDEGVIAPESGAESGGHDASVHDGGGTSDAGQADGTTASDSGAQDATTTESGEPEAAPAEAGPGDAGSDAPFVTAAHPRMPLVVDQGGPVIATPHFTSVTFASTYVNAVSDLDTFVSEIGSQPFWAATTSEYGVAAPVVESPQHLTQAAPATITDAQIQTWLANQIKSGAAGFADASSSSVFVLFYPSTTTISQTSSSKSCQQFGGYHGSAEATVNKQPVLVTYAVIPECVSTGDGGAGSSTTLQDTTAATSHELVEACTDPYVNRTAEDAWVGTAIEGSASDPYAAWSMSIVGGYNYIELGDMCESFGSSFFTPTGFAYQVQRTWSNAAVKASHDPCEPYNTLESAYFLAQPVFDPNFAVNEAQTPPVYLPSVGFTSQGQAMTTQGVQIPVGQSATIPLILWSDAPVGQPWTVTVRDPAVAVGGTSPYLSFSQDKTTGNNGDTIQLTITVTAANTTLGGEVFVVTSTDGVLKHSTYGFVGN